MNIFETVKDPELIYSGISLSTRALTKASKSFLNRDGTRKAGEGAMLLPSPSPLFGDIKI